MLCTVRRETKRKAMQSVVEFTNIFNSREKKLSERSKSQPNGSAG